MTPSEETPDVRTAGAGQEPFSAAPEEKPSEPVLGTAPSVPSSSAQKKNKKHRTKNAGKIRRRRRRILERTADNDIRYRGPFSYRHFRIFAWICLMLAQIIVLMRLDQKIEPGYAAVYDTPLKILAPISSLALPFFLIANFATILEGQEGYGRQITRFGSLSLGVIVSFYAIYNRYFLGSMAVLIQDRSEAAQYVELLLAKFFPQGFICFNLFIDLFLCSLFMYLLNGRPAKHFQGKRLVVFRLLAVLPVLYELASIILKILSNNRIIRLPFWSYPFLTTKPPLTFIVFILLAFYVKKRERIFRKHERTHEDFQQYMQTNYNSLRFSLYASRIFFFMALLDILLVFLVPLIQVLILQTPVENYVSFVQAMTSSGFGGTVILIPMIPFMLLFSYTRTHKNRTFDAVLPTIGITLIVLVYIEGFYQALQMLAPALPDGIGNVVKALLTYLAGP